MYRPRPALYQCTSHFTIPFHDIDAMRVLWHGHYLKYCERAREDFIASLGLSYADMEKHHRLFPVVDFALHYRKPLELSEQISVITKLISYEGKIVIDYEFYKEDGSLACTASSTQVCMDMEHQTMDFVLPSFVLSKIEASLCVALQP